MDQYFGQQALQTFADSVSAVTGSRVHLVVRGNQAYTDGTTVYLPTPGTLGAEDFRALCGIALHEVSHVWFESVAHLDQLLREFPDTHHEVARTCFNVIIDVADETRMEKALPGAAQLFATSAEQSLQLAMQKGTIPDRPPAKVDSRWAFLAVPMLWVRSAPGSTTRGILRGWRQRPGVLQVTKLLSRARDRSRRGLVRPLRTAHQWKRIDDLTRALVELVTTHFPPEEQPPSDNESRQRQPADFDVMSAWAKAIIERAASDDRQADTPPDATESNWQTALPDADDTTDEPGSTDPVEPNGRPSGDDDDGACDWYHWGAMILDLEPPRILRRVRFGDGDHAVAFDESVRQSVLPAFRQCARKLVRAPTATLQRGYDSGSRIGQTYRLATDGRVFSRRVRVEQPSSSIAMIFDQSHSMRSILPTLLPVGVAMAQSLDELSGVHVAAFRFGDAVEQVEPLTELRNIKLMGSTHTHAALAAARQWLARVPASRQMIVLVTDGEPDDPQACSDLVTRLTRAGVSLLVGSIGVGIEACARCFPRATVIDLEPSRAAASLHVAIRRLCRQVH